MSASDELLFVTLWVRLRGRDVVQQNTPSTAVAAQSDEPVIINAGNISALCAEQKLNNITLSVQECKLFRVMFGDV